MNIKNKDKDLLPNSSVLSNFSNNAKLLQNNHTPVFPEKKLVLHKKENSGNLSLDNFEAESNLDLSLGESFCSNLNTKENNLPNSYISTNMLSTPKIQQMQPKAESDSDRIANSNINNNNAFKTNFNNSTNDTVNKNNIHLNSSQNNLINNNLSQSSPSNFGNVNNKNLETIKEHQLENETDDIVTESLDSKVNKYNISINQNDIKSKSINNPSYFLNKNELLFNSGSEKTNQNRIEILVKNNKIENNLNNALINLNKIDTPTNRIEKISAKNNNDFISANNNLDYTKKDNKEIYNTPVIINNEKETFNNRNYNNSLEAPKKPVFEFSNESDNLIKENKQDFSKSSVNGSSIDDILKKYGIKIDENTAEVVPLNQINKPSEKGEELKNEIKMNINESSNNIEMIRKSIVKLKETDLATLQKEFIEKEEVFSKKKENENLLNESNKEESRSSINVLENSSIENKTKKSDSFSSRVQKILESGDKQNNISNSNINNIDFSQDSKRRNTFSQLQNDSNKKVIFNLEKEQNNITNNSELHSIKNFPETRNSATQQVTNINFSDSTHKNNQNEDLEESEFRNKEKLIRNSGIFMKRAKLQIQEKEESKPIIGSNHQPDRKSTYKEKITSSYLNELNEEDDEINRKRRNTNKTSENKLNLNSINLDSNGSINNANQNINNKLNNSNEKIEIINPTHIKNSQKNINININEINKAHEHTQIKDNEVISPDANKGNRVSGLMKRPNSKDLLLEDENNQEKEGSNKDKENENKLPSRDNFMKKLNANILKRGSYKDTEDSDFNDNPKGINQTIFLYNFNLIFLN